jgi:hypothetical protein
MTVAKKNTLEKRVGDLERTLDGVAIDADTARRYANTVDGKCLDLSRKIDLHKEGLESVREGYQEWTSKVNSEGNLWFGWSLVNSILFALLVLVLACHANWLRSLERKIESQRDVAARLLDADETDLNKAAAVEIARLRATVEALSKNESHK